MARKGYRFVAHTADVEFIAGGKDVGEAFKNAALAMFDTIADTDAMRKSKGRRVGFAVAVRADGYDDLLWKMLQRCLTISSARGLFCYAMSKPKIKMAGGALALKATVSALGERPEVSRLEVKGVSRYGLAVSKSRAGFSASVVVDV